MELAILIISTCVSLFVLYLVAVAILTPLAAVFTGLGHLLGGEYASKNARSRALRVSVRDLLAKATAEGSSLSRDTYIRLRSAVGDLLRDEHKPVTGKHRAELCDLLQYMRDQHPAHEAAISQYEYR